MKIKLQLTDGYSLHFDQVTRILQYSSNQKYRKTIPREEFLENLGLTERQFENLSSICVGLGLIKPRVFVLTSLGAMIAQNDIFFDNIDTLWILHYVISSEPKWVVWNRLINQILTTESIIRTDISLPYYSDLSTIISGKTFKHKLPKEILSVLNAYSDQKFARLNIIKKTSPGEYIRSEPTKIEQFPFLYCLLDYRDKRFSGTTGLVIKDIANYDNSPGRVLYLPEYDIENLLNKLHDFSLIRKETFGDLEQIRFADGLTKAKALSYIYGKEK